MPVTKTAVEDIMLDDKICQDLMQQLKQRPMTPSELRTALAQASDACFVDSDELDGVLRGMEIFGYLRFRGGQFSLTKRGELCHELLSGHRDPSSLQR